MKYLIPLIVLFLSLSVKSQSKIAVGLGTGIAYIPAYYEKHSDIMFPLTASFKYGRNEVYAGWIWTEMEMFILQSHNYNINGPIAGFRYHFPSKNRNSHFLLDANFQHRKYASDIGTIPYKIPEDTTGMHYPYSNITFLGKAWNMHLSAGYEAFLGDRISINALAGLGIVYHKMQPTTFGMRFGYNKTEAWEFRPYFSLNIRVYLIKQKTIMG